MSKSSPDLSSTHVSPIYAFVVLSLAAFLTMFTFCRKPGIVFETQSVFQLSQLPAGVDLDQVREGLEETMLAPEYVLDAMRNADIIRGDTSPETLAIAKNIARRMRLSTATQHDQNYARLTLVTERPEAGMDLLNGMVKTLQPADAASGALEAYPATITRQRGGSINAERLLVLCIAAAVVGLFGLVLCDRAKKSPILLTNEDVTTVTGVPVVGDFFDESTAHEARERQIYRQRSFSFALRIAELGVAAVFVLMVYQLATKDALLNRFLIDPLAVYGEVLTRVIG